MATLTITRRIDPYDVSANISFNREDIQKAFETPTDPDEVLFYEMFSEDFRTRPISEQLDVLMRVARLIENRQAAVLEGTATTEPRGT